MTLEYDSPVEVTKEMVPRQDSQVPTMRKPAKDERFVIVYDTDLRRPACVLLQAVNGWRPGSSPTLLRGRQRMACRPHTRHEARQWNGGGMGKGRTRVGNGAAHFLNLTRLREI